MTGDLMRRPRPRQSIAALGLESERDSDAKAACFGPRASAKTAHMPTPDPPSSDDAAAPISSADELLLSLNGKPRRVRAGTTVSGLLGELGLTSQQVAVERNGQVVPRKQHAETALSAGDALEVVTFVGGG